MEHIDWIESRLLDILKFDLSEKQIDTAVEDSRRYAIPQAGVTDYQLDVRQWDLIGQLAGVRTIQEQITPPLPETLTAEHAMTLVGYAFGIGTLCGKSSVPPYPAKMIQQLSAKGRRLQQSFAVGKREHPINNLMLTLSVKFRDIEGRLPRLNELLPLLTRQSGKGIVHRYEYDADCPDDTIFYCGKDEAIEITFSSLKERFTKMRKKLKQ